MKIQLRMPMKLKMSVHVAGADYAFKPGDVTDRFPNAEALRLIERGYAVPVPDDAEHAVKVRPAAETRPARRGKRG
jgi:hypothetical protein